MTPSNTPLLQGTLDMIVLGRKHLSERRATWERFAGALDAVLRVT